MVLDSNLVYGLIGEKYRGNLNAFAKAIDVDRVVVWRALNGRTSGARKFIPAFVRYCKRNGLNFMDYVSSSE